MKNTRCKGLGLQSLGTFLILQFCHELLASLKANFSMCKSDSAQHEFATADANQHQILGSKGTHGECCSEFIPHDISCGKNDICRPSVHHPGILCAWPRLLRKRRQNPVVPRIGWHGLAFIRQGSCNLRNECRIARIYKVIKNVHEFSIHVMLCRLMFGDFIVPCGFLCLWVAFDQTEWSSTLCGIWLAC